MTLWKSIIVFSNELCIRKDDDDDKERNCDFDHVDPWLQLKRNVKKLVATLF